MTNTDPLESARYCIDQGKYHTENFKTLVIDWIKTNPYKFVCEVEPETGDHVDKIKLVKPMPERLRGTAKDAINNLRDALDQTMFALVNKFTYFPFGKTSGDFENAVKGRLVNKVPSEIINLIRFFKPYERGNDLLYAVNVLSNANKHGIIAATAADVHRMKAAQIIVGGGRNVRIFQNKGWDFAKNELELNRFGAGTTFHQCTDFDITLVIGFYGVPIVEGKEAIAVLYEFIRIVEGVVNSLESQAKMIGLL